MPQPHTIWNEVRQLEPGHLMKLNLKSLEVEKQNYWKLPTGINDLISEEDVIRRLKSDLKRSIISRTESDVPIACFLSGGVDSGLIVSMLAKYSSKPVKTFTVGFDFDNYNELADAEELAKI